MVSFNNYIKTDNYKNKITDDPYPTVTIIDSTKEKNVLVDDDEPIRKSCLIIPERVFVTVILSLYIFFGILITSISFMALAFSSTPLDQAQYGINGSLFAFLAVAGIFGLIAMRNDNAILLRRLSISFWILTVLMLILNVTDYIISIVSKPESVKECQNSSDQATGEDGEILDCDKIVNYFLIRNAFELLFTEAISIYFTHTIASYSKRLLTKSKFRSNLNNNQTNNNNIDNVSTYQIYTTSSPPTSDDWKPPQYSLDDKI